MKDLSEFDVVLSSHEALCAEGVFFKKRFLWRLVIVDEGHRDRLFVAKKTDKLHKIHLGQLSQKLKQVRLFFGFECCLSLDIFFVKICVFFSAESIGRLFRYCSQQRRQPKRRTSAYDRMKGRVGVCYRILFGTPLPLSACGSNNHRPACPR